ncbi:hypothetical protein [Sphingomonas sanguinis]
MLLATGGFGIVRGNPAAASSSRPVAGGGLCQAGETKIFACPIGGKLVAVCGVGKQAVYRYGRPGRIEMTARAMTLAQRAYSGGGETQIQVANKDYRYILFDKTVRTGFGADGRNMPDMRSGLIVQRGGRTLSNRECDDDAPISTSKAVQFMPSGGRVVAH